MRKNLLYYDVESFPNFFMITTRIRSSKGVTNQNFFVADVVAGRDWFGNTDLWQVGYNSAGYDDVMISYWLTNDNMTDEDMYEMNDYLINSIATPRVQSWIDANVSEFKFMKFGQERVNRNLKPFKPAHKILGGFKRKPIDLYILGEKSGSLKNAATVLGVNSLVETPVEFGKALTEDEKADVIKYCQNDVDVTELAYDYYEQNMVVRDEFKSKYKIMNAHNIGSAKLAEKYLIAMHKSKCDELTFKQWEMDLNRYLESTPETKKGDMVSKLTKDYTYEFADGNISALYDKISKAYLSYLPIVQSDVDIYTTEAVDFDKWRKDARKPSAFYIGGEAIPKGMLMFEDDRQNKYKFGIGGLHNDAPKGKWKTNDEYQIWNVDVTSYYPSLIASNGYSPQAFPQFSSYIDMLLADRKIAKAAGNKIESDSKKLVLNSSFGKTKDKHSKLYDPLAHFSVTINGQLLLLKLIDMIHIASPGAKLLNCNTDGVCFYLPKTDLDATRDACTKWETLSKVNLEEDLFDVWFQSTCNGYCAKTDGGAIKSKGGDFKLKPASLKETFAKSPAMKKALVHYTLSDVPIEETLLSLPVKDFCLTMNFGKKTQLVIDDEVVPKKVLRFIYAKNGTKFRKFTPSSERYSIVGKGRDLQMVDVLDDVDTNDVDIGLYARDVKEMVLDIMMERASKCLPKKVRDSIDETFDEWSKNANI